MEVSQRGSWVPFCPSGRLLLSTVSLRTPTGIFVSNGSFSGSTGLTGGRLSNSSGWLVVYQNQHGAGSILMICAWFIPLSSILSPPSYFRISSAFSTAMAASKASFGIPCLPSLSETFRFFATGCDTVGAASGDAVVTPGGSVAMLVVLVPFIPFGCQIGVLSIPLMISPMVGPAGAGVAVTY